MGATADADELIVPSTFIPISMLKTMWKAKIKQMNAPKPNLQSGTDPNRHDGDTPHLRPDGGDNRDELPTEGRSLEDYLKKYWFDSFNENKLLFYTSQTTYLFFKSSIRTFVEMVNKKTGMNLDNDDWIDTYSEKISKEFYNTLWKESETKNIYTGTDYNEDRDKYINNQINSNPRLAKICNSTLRSCINYIRFKYLDEAKLKKVWVVNSNVCGHKGRIKVFETDSLFKIGDSDIRFPGETFNLNCRIYFSQNLHSKK